MGQGISDAMCSIVTYKAFEPRLKRRRYSPDLPSVYISRELEDCANSFIPVLVVTPGTAMRERYLKESRASAGSHAGTDLSTVSESTSSELTDAEMSDILEHAKRKRIVPESIGRELHDAPAVILYSHGNAENLSSAAFQFNDYAIRTGMSFVCYDYPGYGCNIGDPTEITVIEDIKHCYTWLTRVIGVHSKRIVLVGRSIGSGPAIALAKYLCDAKVDVPGGLFIISGYSSIVSVVSPALASSSPASDIFKNSDAISSVTIPIGIAHGDHDEVIKPWHANKLFESAKTKDKWLVIIENAHHNDMDKPLKENMILLQFVLQHGICTKQGLASALRSAHASIQRSFITSNTEEPTNSPLAPSRSDQVCALGSQKHAPDKEAASGRKKGTIGSRVLASLGGGGDEVSDDDE